MLRRNMSSCTRKPHPHHPLILNWQKMWVCKCFMGRSFRVICKMKQIIKIVSNNLITTFSGNQIPIFNFLMTVDYDYLSSPIYSSLQCNWKPHLPDPVLNTKLQKTFEAYDLTEFCKQIAKKGKNCPERQIVKRAIQKIG